MDMGNKAPWEKPEIAMILSIFDGKVVDIKQTNIVEVQSNGEGVER